MGVFLCLGQEIHAVKYTDSLTDFSSFQEIHNYMSIHNRILVFLGEGTHKLKKTGGATGVPDRHRQHRRVLGRIRLKRLLFCYCIYVLYDFELCVCVYMWLIFIKFMCFFEDTPPVFFCIVWCVGIVYFFLFHQFRDYADFFSGLV
jgi:hypothetical protein